jgi:hypothetical protein
MDSITGNALPLSDMVAKSTSPTVVTPNILAPPGNPSDMSLPEDNTRKEYYVPPIGLDWEFSQELLNWSKIHNQQAHQPPTACQMPAVHQAKMHMFRYHLFTVLCTAVM